MQTCASSQLSPQTRASQRGNAALFTRNISLRQQTGRLRAKAESRGNSQQLQQRENLTEESGSKAAWGLVPLILKAQSASADDLDPAQPSGIGIGEILVLLAPILLYGVFSLYREKLNPQAKLSDFLFIAAAVVIVLNILSIVILKVRLF